MLSTLMRASVLWTFTLLILATASCSAATRTGATNPDEITTEEIQASTAQDAYELIQRLRPRWLRSRGSRSLTMSTEIVVFLNRTRMGGLDSLRDISTNSIRTVEYLDAARAIGELPGLGSEHAEAAIVVLTYSRDGL